MVRHSAGRGRRVNASAAANTSAAYWITNDIVYTVDMHRGIDVLRVDRAS